MKYRKLPVVIDAVQFNGSSSHAAQLKKWINGGKEPEDGGIHTRDIVTFEIPTLEGVHTASPGDYIIRGVAGEFYPCKPDIFEQTYTIEHLAEVKEEPRTIYARYGNSIGKSKTLT